MCGIGLGYFYINYANGSDTYRYHTQSLVVYDYFQEHPSKYFYLLLSQPYQSSTFRHLIDFATYSNSYFLVLVLSLLNIITNGSYYLNSVYFSLFCFFGVWQLIRVLNHLNTEYKVPVVFSFLLFPSVAFWSSGVMKEPIYLGALCWLFAATLTIAYQERNNNFLKHLLQGIIAAYLVWKMRYYFAAVVFPLLFSFALVKLLANKLKLSASRRRTIVIFGGWILVIALFLSQLQTTLNLEFFLEQLMKNYHTLLKASEGKPVIELTNLEPTVCSVMLHAPLALLQTIYRPFLGEGTSFFYWVAGLENLFILGLSAFSLIGFIKKSPKEITFIFIIMGIYILVVGALLGLTTPNFGTLNRYRIAILPFLVFILLQGSFTYWRFRKKT
ncbi:hypothetical protein [Adhaeribacter aquaticus]|uniref:hypothetical protein n=1 Tax=Adhaeribacter aquaticus TaxID=299567 RepID=UPI0012FA48A0|nr:hypothetical protein [Adhaeribacter aquaticus]